MGGGVNELTLYPNEGDPLRLSPAQVDPYAAECDYFVEYHPPRHPRRPRHPGRRHRRRWAVSLAARGILERVGERVTVPGGERCIVIPTLTLVLTPTPRAL